MPYFLTGGPITRSPGGSSHEQLVAITICTKVPPLKEPHQYNWSMRLKIRITDTHIKSDQV